MSFPERRFAIVTQLTDDPDAAALTPLAILSAEQPDITLSGALRVWWEPLNPEETDPWRLGRVYMRSVVPEPYKLVVNDKIMRTDTAYLVDTDVIIADHEHLDSGVQIKLVPDSQFHNGYEMLKKVGNGGFGSVYEVRHRKTKKHFAVKEILVPANLKRSAERFMQRSIRRELDIISQTRHKCVVAMEEIFIEREGQINYIVMELALCSLTEHMKLNAPYSAAVTHSLVSQICSGLAYLHVLSIVHRDVKSDNIVVTSYIPLRVKLTDFGLSKSTNGTCLASYCGTPAYMAPEIRVTGQQYDHKVDAYAMGWVVAALLLGPSVVTSKEIRDYIRESKVLALKIMQKISAGLRAQMAADVLQDFLGKLLEWRAERRMSIKEAMSHAYLRREGYIVPTLEPPRASLLRIQPVSDRPPLVVKQMAKEKMVAGVYGVPRSTKTAAIKPAQVRQPGVNTPQTRQTRASVRNRDRTGGDIQQPTGWVLASPFEADKDMPRPHGHAGAATQMLPGAFPRTIAPDTAPPIPEDGAQAQSDMNNALPTPPADIESPALQQRTPYAGSPLMHVLSAMTVPGTTVGRTGLTVWSMGALLALVAALGLVYVVCRVD